jgi:glycosyltransferase involved in cell wall biosynthesis
MKILVVCQYFYPEEFKVNELVEGLVARGNDVTVLTGKPTYPRGPYPKGYKFFGVQKEEYKGAKIIRVPELTRGNGGSIGIVKSMLSFMFFSRWYARWHKIEADAILCFQLSPVTMAIPALVYQKKLGVKYVHWVQDLWPESVTATTSIKGGPVVNWLNKLVTKIYKRADIILVQSKAFEKSICEKGDFKNKLVFAPNWAEDSIANGEQHSADCKLPEGFKVMFAGNIGVAQDFENIIKAADLTRDIPEIKWVIVGDGRDREHSEKEVQRLGLEKQVVFVGRHPVNTMPWFFKQADAMLVSLKDEFIFSLTIPSKVQAYMASAKPIVTMLNGEGSRVVEEAGCGLTANSCDYKTLAENVKKLYAMNAEDREKMGSAGRAFYDKVFAKEKVIDSVNEILKP